MRRGSAILPCYSDAWWISRAVKSILAQTCEHFEPVIIDDGSTEGSYEMMASHLCDERMRYFYQENRGFSAAVNRGIKEGSGSLISFIGQDDLWMPDKLEVIVYSLLTNLARVKPHRISKSARLVVYRSALKSCRLVVGKF